MIRPVVSGNPVMSPVMLIGQAPGVREGPMGKPFAWTAGKTMFGWFGDTALGLGITEEEFRDQLYMAAVCRCFPGKAKGGGDRVPDEDEVARCSKHLSREVDILRPRLVIPVGKLAIEQLFPDLDKLVDVVGVQQRVTFHGHEVDMIALPHPSGASTWHRVEPGKTLLVRALSLIAQHSAWREIKRSIEATRAAAPPKLAIAEGATDQIAPKRRGVRAAALKVAPEAPVRRASKRKAAHANAS
jgi:uracil-DNA glycosylase